ncbi:MAG: hypothetical protein WCJ83_05545 [Actinomycetes bacterium]|jgi:hypothetical protein
MESLALLVTIIFLVLILSGPLAIALTFVKTTKRWANILKRIFICQFSAIGIGLGVMLLLQGIPVGTKLLALSAIAVSAYALKREFKRK